MSFIYALVCPKTNEIRYIGKADRPNSRLTGHISLARSGRYENELCNWIRELLAGGRFPVLKVLHKVPNGVDWKDAERCAIAMCRANGCRLTNVKDGGEGPNLQTEDDKRRWAERASKSWGDPQIRQKRIAGMRLALSTEEGCRRRSEAQALPETKAKRAVSMQASVFGNPEVMARRRASQTEASNRPDVKAAKGAASKARWQDPEFRARMYESRVAAWIKRKERKDDALQNPPP